MEEKTSLLFVVRTENYKRIFFYETLKLLIKIVSSFIKVFFLKIVIQADDI